MYFFHFLFLFLALWGLVQMCIRHSSVAYITAMQNVKKKDQEVQPEYLKCVLKDLSALSLNY